MFVIVAADNDRCVNDAVTTSEASHNTPYPYSVPMCGYLPWTTSGTHSPSPCPEERGRWEASLKPIFNSLHPGGAIFAQLVSISVPGRHARLRKYQ